VRILKLPRLALQRLRHTKNGREAEEVPFNEIKREQEQLAALDTSLDEAIGAIGSAREIIVDRLKLTQQDEIRPSPGNTLALVKAGRQEVLQRFARQSNPREVEEDSSLPQVIALREMTQQFALRLEAIVTDAANAGTDTDAVEQLIRSTIESYLKAIRRTLTPLRFNSPVDEGGDSNG
jgi:Mg2+ and Co2+ transporter CorA